MDSKDWEKSKEADIRRKVRSSLKGGLGEERWNDDDVPRKG